MNISVHGIETVQPVTLQSSPLVNEGLTRASSVIGFSDLCRELGLSPEVILARYGLSVEALSEPENIIPMSIIGKILQDAADAADCQHFGLLLGGQQDPSILGVLFLIMLQMETVEEACIAMQQHFHRHNIGANFTIQKCGGFGELTYDIWLPNSHLQIQGLSLALAAIVNLMQVLAGPSWKPEEVHFSFPRPRDVLPYQRFFDAPVFFGQHKSCIFFSDHWLDMPLRGKFPMFQHLVNRYLETQTESVQVSQVSWSLRVESLIRTLLSQGQANIEQISKAFGISRRTLHRRLALEGNTFASILSRVRFDVIEQLLSRPELTLTEIAYLAGFSDSSVFSRAFHQRHNIPPRKYRELLLKKTSNIVPIRHFRQPYTVHNEPTVLENAQ